MHKMLQTNKPKDYLIASGKTTSLRDFVSAAFEVAGLDHKPYIVSDKSFMRPSDLDYSAMDPSLIKEDLGWEAKIGLTEIVKKMYEGELT